MSANERRQEVERVERRPAPGSVAGERVERTERIEQGPEVARAGAPGSTNVNVSRTPARETVSAVPDYSAIAVAKVTQVLWFICAVLELLLAVRVLLLLFGANRSSPFAQFILAVSQPFAWPFLGLFPNPATSGGAAPSGSVFELTTVIAMVVYFLLFLLLTQLLSLLVSRPRVRA